MNKIILAGGCFWGMEDLFRKQIGVTETRVGYTGGHTNDPTYPKLCRGDTGHAEAIEITYDETQTNYRDLLIFFFKMHDPTTVNRQGNDLGSQYRSAIFYQTEEQKEVAEKLIKDIDAAGFLTGKIVTEVTPATTFYEAEEDHQDYLEKHPNGYTCHFIRDNWQLPE